MQRSFWWRPWMRLFLWVHAVSIVVFYLTLWRRTAPAKGDRVNKLPPDSSTAPRTRPLVSFVLPARNEERNIKRCVTSLLEQDYEPYEIIAVDDGSEDATGAILDELVRTHPNGHRLYVLRLRDLPAGWAGKPHAIHMGTQEAQGDWLLFTDADTWHAPNALRSAITQAEQEHADLFTLGTQQDLPTFWDRVLMPMAFLGVGMLYPPRLVNDPTSSVAVANGQYILIRRKVYDLIGGYARPDLRGTLLDDRDLAHVVKENGFKLHFVDGEDLVHVKMYNNFDEIWRGWRKNAYLGNRGGIPFILTQISGLPMISIVPFLAPLLTRLAGVKQGERAALSIVELTPVLAYRFWLNKHMRVPWYYVFTYPLAGAVFTGILAQSTWRILTRKGVDWRGREYYNHR